MSGLHSLSETSASDESATEQQRFWTKGLSLATSNAVPRFLGRETCEGAGPRGGRGNTAAGWGAVPATSRSPLRWDPYLSDDLLVSANLRHMLMSLSVVRGCGTGTRCSHLVWTSSDEHGGQAAAQPRAGGKKPGVPGSW